MKITLEVNRDNTTYYLAQLKSLTSNKIILAEGETRPRAATAAYYQRAKTDGAAWGELWKE